MPWIVGIDEAGYGPNLGPLVMTAVAFRMPKRPAGIDVWQLLRRAVRRAGEPDDGRLLVEDSKVVYSPNKGLLDLETSALAVTCPEVDGTTATLGRLVDQWCPASHGDLRDEPWYAGTSSIPVAAETVRVRQSAGVFGQACGENHIRWGPVHSVVVCPSRFNRLLQKWGSKGAVLHHALAALVARSAEPKPVYWDHDTEPVSFFIDKHGGRNTYAAMLQDAIGEGMVVVHEEGMDRSVYSVLGLKRQVRVTFQPRAEAEHFGVAVASIISKYLRELLMREFNQFWTERVPDLRPTAGYPTDAARFWKAIQPAVKRMGLPVDSLWRRR
jgi:ribonuclease HII